MTKSKATELAKVINYFAAGYQGEVWQAEIYPGKEEDWKVEVKVRRLAFKHELNALMMVVDNTRFTSCSQRVDDNGELIWRIW